MEISITNSRTCATLLPSYQACVDYQVPAIQQIFAKFLNKYPRIHDYNNCHFIQGGDASTISCSSGSYVVYAMEVKFNVLGYNQLSISVRKNEKGEHDYESLLCDKNGCNASNSENDFSYSFHHYSNSECLESLTHNSDKVIPCDGEVSLFDEYLKLSSIVQEVDLAPVN